MELLGGVRSTAGELGSGEPAEAVMGLGEGKEKDG